MKKLIGVAIGVLLLANLAPIFQFPVNWLDQNNKRSFYCEDYSLTQNLSVKVGASSATAWHPIHHAWITAGGIVGTGAAECSLVVYDGDGRVAGYYLKLYQDAVPIMSTIMNTYFGGNPDIEYIEIKQTSDHTVLYAWNALIEDGGTTGTINEQ